MLSRQLTTSTTRYGTSGTSFAPGTRASDVPPDGQAGSTNPAAIVGVIVRRLPPTVKSVRAAFTQAAREGAGKTDASNSKKKQTDPLMLRTRLLLIMFLPVFGAKRTPLAAGKRN